MHTRFLVDLVNLAHMLYLLHNNYVSRSMLITGLTTGLVACAPGPLLFKLLEGLVRDATWG
jgi:hypothetical protein